MLQIITTEKELSEILSKILGSTKSTTPEQTETLYLTTPKVAEILGRSVNAIRVMVFKNQLKYIKKGGKLYFDRKDIIDYLESGRVNIHPVNAVDVLKTKKV
jgi:hypothetical protein